MNMPGMQPGAGPTGTPSTDALALALRLVLLLSTAALAGFGIARPLAREAGQRRPVLGRPVLGRPVLGLPAMSWSVLAWSAAAVAALASAVSVTTLHTSAPLAGLHVVLALALPALLRWPRLAATDGAALAVLLLAETSLQNTGLVFAGDVFAVAGTIASLVAAVLDSSGSTTRDRALALGGALALLLAGLAQVASSGVGIDRRLYETGYGILLVALTVLPLAALVAVAAVRTRGVREAGAAVAALAFLAWGALPAVAQPAALPVPGLPLLAQTDNHSPVLVSPQRPGANLVHFPSTAGNDLTVTTEDGQRVRAEPRQGAEGTWAQVNLPPGRSDLAVDRGGRANTIEVDTGQEPPLPSATGADGPECASSALGGLVAGSRAPLTHCPADALSPTDADALRQLVGYTASRGTPGITIAADGSPRSQQAARFVRDRAAQAHLPTTDAPEPDNALVDVAGWSASSELLNDIAYQQATRPTYASGVYLAPWLLHTPVVNKLPTSFLPLRFNPRDQQALSYSVALENAFGKEAPSTPGFDQWLDARRETTHDSPAVYASAQVSAMPMNAAEDMPGMSTGMGGDYPGQWVSGGTIVPISGPLAP